MPQAETIEPIPMDPAQDVALPIYVRLKQHWADDWVVYPEMIAISAELAAGSMGEGQFVFELPYGPQEKLPWETAPVCQPKFDDLRGWWVQIQIGLGEAQTALWVGVVEGPQAQPEGDTVKDSGGTFRPTGRQRWVAYGPLRVLKKCTFVSSYWRTAANATPYALDWVPDFNIRGSNPGLSGNRAAELAWAASWELGTFVFGGSALWAADDVVEYALRYAQDQNPTGPTWELGGDSWYLVEHYPRIQMASVSDVLQLIRTCIPNDRGIDFSVSVTPTGFSLDVYGLTDKVYEFGDNQNLDNLNVVPMPVTDRRSLEVSFEKSGREQYDYLWVVGDRVLSVFSVGTGAPDLAGVLEGNWSAAERTAYLAGKPGGAGTAAENDAFRADERFRRVFQSFEAQYSTFTYDTGHANPVFTDAGTLWYSAGYFQAYQIETLPRIPLEVGVDYTQWPPVGRNPAGVSAEYLPPLVLAQNPRDTNRWVWLNKPGASGTVPSAEVSPLPHGLGVLVRTNPNHVLAATWWAGAMASAFTPDATGFAWDRMVVTLAVETDIRIGVGVQLPEELRAGNGAIKTILAPLAQFWILARNTVVGVDANGALLRAPATDEDGDGLATPMLLRDDRAMLKSYIPGAIARFCHDRTLATVARRGCIAPWQAYVGAILRLEGEQGELELPTPVTSVRWDFRERVTTIYCGQAERHVGGRDMANRVQDTGFAGAKGAVR